MLFKGNVMELLEAFEKYEGLFSRLNTLINSWAINWRILDSQILVESYLKENIPENDKKELETKIANLEIDIENCEKDIVNLINIIQRLLQQSFVYDFNIINSINRYHINAMQQYANIINVFKKTKDEYIGRDINIDFTKLENSKLQLNQKIKEFNYNFIRGNKVRLLTVNEAQTLADKETLDFLKNRQNIEDTLFLNKINHNIHTY